MTHWEIQQGDALDRLRDMPAESVQCVITSPPYYGLRDYGTGEWEGGSSGCDHTSVRRNHADEKQATSAGTSRDPIRGGDCRLCGARRVDQQLGLENTPDEYVARMVEVFREVRRVLRDDGVVFLNLGDSYAVNGGARAYGSTDGLTGRGDAPGEARRAPGGYKPKDLLMIPAQVALALRADGWYLRSEIIWCLSGGVRVYARTQKGDMPMTVKDLVRLDPATVKLWNGQKWTQALGWSRSDAPRDDVLEIQLRSGEHIGCTAGHLWPTQRGNVRADDLRLGDIIDSTTLPEPAVPDMPAALDDARVGWMAGRYLADGSTSGDTIQIAYHIDEADELQAIVADFGRAYHGSAVAHRTVGKSATVNLNGPLSAAVIRAYIYGSSAHDKGIQPRAWRRSNVFLRALLDGYLSGDGHYDAPNDRWRLGFTRNDRLAGDLRTLCARLGMTLTLRMSMATGFGRSWPCYRGELRFVRSGHHNQKQRAEVAGIGRSRARQFWDIGVNDEPHTFALASGVLTHNSKPNPMPESVTDRPTNAHEKLFLFAKSARYFYDADAIRLPQARLWDPTTNGDGPNFAGNLDPRNDSVTQTGHRGTRSAPNPAGANRRNVWEIATQPYPDAHFATFPEKLVEPCVLAGSSPRACGECGAPWRRVVERTTMMVRPGPSRDARRLAAGGASESRRAINGTMTEAPASRTVGWRSSCDHDDDTGRCVILDPFAGSGTVGVVALRHDRSFIGIELNPEYCEMARRRIRDDAPLFNATTETATRTPRKDP